VRRVSHLFIKVIMLRKYRRPLLGAALGVVASASDALLLRLLGVSMQLQGHDVMIPAVALFALTATALGAVVGWLLDSRDQVRAQAGHISAQLNMLQYTQRALAQEEALGALGRMAAGVAHEVRNPLGVIRASAGLLAADIPAGSDAEQAARFIEEEVDRLDDFITRLLDLSRPLELRRAPASSREVAAQAIALTSGLDVALHGSPAQQLAIDPALTVRALAALLRNAREAGARRVELRCIPTGFEVADDGPGIPAQVAAQDIFAPFVTTRPQGTGLGLAMVKKLVEFQGGRASVLEGRGAGPDGQGACIAIVFPVPGASP
jgi:signal transduction histidine kinase